MVEISRPDDPRDVGEDGDLLRIHEIVLTHCAARPHECANLEVIRAAHGDAGVGRPANAVVSSEMKANPGARG